MATRRDELNAYTFARKRTVAAFLQPSPHGSEEAAPRPLKAIMPSLVTGVLIVVGFGAWGVLKPGAPKGWDNTGEKVIVGSESTTRYVVLETDGKKKRKQLHPVLNLASAKLLLDPSKFGVVKVNEAELDKSGIRHGATIGIPYAPDRLPDDKDAEDPKYWALCEQPGGSQQAAQKTVFVLNKKDRRLVGGKNRLTAKDALFVEGPGNIRYLVDSTGTAYPLGDPRRQSNPADLDLLRRVVFDQRAVPQEVTGDWLRTLNPGSPIHFPRLEGATEASRAPNLASEYARIGLVLEAQTGSGPQKYVVLRDRVAPVSDFTARLLLGSQELRSLYPGSPKAMPIAPGDITPSAEDFMAEARWPQAAVVQANAGQRKVSCTVWHGSHDSSTKLPVMSTWAGREHPQDVAQSGTGTYVSSGSGLLYRQTNTPGSKVGSVFLVTDTGLRYSIQVNNDSRAGGAGKADEETDKARVRLGYEKTEPVPVPKVWSELLSRGPKLTTEGARQPQGS